MSINPSRARRRPQRLPNTLPRAIEPGRGGALQQRPAVGFPPNFSLNLAASPGFSLRVPTADEMTRILWSQFVGGVRVFTPPHAGSIIEVGGEKQLQLEFSVPGAPTAFSDVILFLPDPNGGNCTPWYITPDKGGARFIDLYFGAPVNGTISCLAMPLSDPPP